MAARCKLFLELRVDTANYEIHVPDPWTIVPGVSGHSKQSYGAKQGIRRS